MKETQEEENKMNTQGILIKLVNAVWLIMVLGCVGYVSMDRFTSSERKSFQVRERDNNFGVLVEEDVSLPTTTSKKQRELGKGKGYYYNDCIPLNPTPAPTEGKGKGGKGYWRDLGDSRQAEVNGQSQRALGKGGKGKGDSSPAPVRTRRLY